MTNSKSTLTDADRAFIAATPVARLATVDVMVPHHSAPEAPQAPRQVDPHSARHPDLEAAPHILPHVLPICYVVIGQALYFTVDRKPKSGPPRNLKRLRNILANPVASVVIDRYDHDDWSRLDWLMLSGPARIIAPDAPLGGADHVPGHAAETGGGNDAEHAEAQAALKARYRQYQDMALADLPVVAITITRVLRWGNLAP